MAYTRHGWVIPGTLPEEGLSWTKHVLPCGGPTICRLCIKDVTNHIPTQKLDEIQTRIAELQYLISELSSSREASLALTKLEECEMWFDKIRKKYQL